MLKALVFQVDQTATNTSRILIFKEFEKLVGNELLNDPTKLFAL